MWFDSHCHLHICEEREPVDALIARAGASGVSKMLTVGIDVASSRRAVEIASHHGIFASVGVHPNDADAWDDGAAATIDDLTRDERVVAVGETGLDFYRHGAARDVQLAAFSAHIDIAKRHDKALVIHTRDSVEAALDVVEHEGPPDRLVFHCWSGDQGALRRALEAGAFVSFAGNVSFPSAQELRELARLVPLDRLLVETDSPFLTPVPHRGKANEPRHVALVGEAVASVRDVSAETVAEATSVNATELLAVGA